MFSWKEQRSTWKKGNHVLMQSHSTTSPSFSCKWLAKKMGKDPAVNCLLQSDCSNHFNPDDLQHLLPHNPPLLWQVTARRWDWCTQCKGGFVYCGTWLFLPLLLFPSLLRSPERIAVGRPNRYTSISAPVQSILSTCCIMQSDGKSSFSRSSPCLMALSK